MNLEVGKKYMTRDGRIATIYDDRGSITFPYRGTIEGDDTIRTWRPNGQYEYDLGARHLDLVSEVSKSFLPLKVGHYYKLNNGLITKIRSMQVDSRSYPVEGCIFSVDRTEQHQHFWTMDGIYEISGPSSYNIASEVDAPSTRTNPDKAVSKQVAELEQEIAELKQIINTIKGLVS